MCPHPMHDNRNALREQATLQYSLRQVENDPFANLMWCGFSLYIASHFIIGSALTVQGHKSPLRTQSAGSVPGTLPLFALTQIAKLY